jgi:hypothetical protein
MSSRTQGRTQIQASAKVGISERSGRRIDGAGTRVTEPKERHWRARKDPFAEVWDSDIVPLLEQQPRLDATTLFEDLQERYPQRFGNGKKRTFQRRVKAWKVLHGPDKEVMFRQVQEPGRQGFSDFTELKDITVTIAGEVLAHRLYHFRLPFSGWSHVSVVLGGDIVQRPGRRITSGPLASGRSALGAPHRQLIGRVQEPLAGRTRRPH